MDLLLWQNRLWKANLLPWKQCCFSFGRKSSYFCEKEYLCKYEVQFSLFLENFCQFTLFLNDRTRHNNERIQRCKNQGKVKIGQTYRHAIWKRIKAFHFHLFNLALTYTTSFLAFPFNHGPIAFATRGASRIMAGHINNEARHFMWLRPL